MSNDANPSEGASLSFHNDFVRRIAESARSSKEAKSDLANDATPTAMELVAENAKVERHLLPDLPPNSSILQVPAPPETNGPAKTSEGAARLEIVPQERPSVIEAARSYLLRGLTPVPIRPRSKAPFEKDWATKPRTKETIATDFSDQGNIGLQLGARSRGLTDVDLDCPEAIRPANAFLPSTPMRCGRQSAPESHRFYIVTDAPNKQKQTWEWPSSGNSNGDGKPTLIELRIGGNDQAKPKSAQSVVPPSIHPATRELIEWVDEYSEPAKAPYEDLREACNKIAIAAVITRAYSMSGLSTEASPGSVGTGGRHDFWRVIGGLLARRGWTDDKTAAEIYREKTCAWRREPDHSPTGN